MLVYSNKRQRISLQEDSGALLRFLYKNPLGRPILWVLTRRFVSVAVGAFMNSALSRCMIGRFIRKNGIDMSKYEERKFCSYNDFFTRRLKKCEFDRNPVSFCSPCDSKLTVFQVAENRCFTIKGVDYTVSELIKDENIANQFCGGYIMIFRLCVDDYHRYCYFDSGKKGPNIYIPGEFHTVRPIAAENAEIYRRNCREYTVMQTDNFGLAVQIEVGAMMVGRIKNLHGDGYEFQKGEEKGYFEFGGSTIALLVQEDAVKIDEDILKNTNEGFETVVRCGERIGTRYIG